MTLILAIPTQHGIVLASDTQYTSGEVRTTGPKIYPLNAQCAWAGAGEIALIQRVQEAIETASTHHSLAEFRDSLARMVQQSVRALLELDVLTEFVQADPSLLLSLHPGDFIFAEFNQGQPRMLHITSSGTPEWISSMFATGNGANFAYALMQKYQNIPLSLESASLLAFKVIDETIQVGAYGLDYPIDIWLIREEGLARLEEKELLLLAEATDTLRKKEIRLLRQVPFQFESVSKSKTKKKRDQSAQGEQSDQGDSKAKETAKKA
jgi:20S proteasome alpha/beta subunit